MTLSRDICVISDVHASHLYTMNFLDPYDIAGPSAAQTQPEQSLNEEVSEVIGSIGRFWGGFRKQARDFTLSIHRGYFLMSSRFCH